LTNKTAQHWPVLFDLLLFFYSKHFSALLVWLLRLMRGCAHKGFFSLHNNMEIAPLWNSHKGSTPPNNGHSFIPLRFTGNLNRLREREFQWQWLLYMLHMKAQSLCGEGGQTPTGRPFIRDGGRAFSLM